MLRDGTLIPTKKFKASCESVIRRLTKAGVTILNWQCYESRGLGRIFNVLVPFGTTVNLSKIWTKPKIYFDLASVRSAIKEKLNITKDVLAEYVGQPTLMVEWVGYPVFDMDWDNFYLINPETINKNKKSQIRVILDCPVRFSDFIENVKKVINKHDINVNSCLLWVVVSGEISDFKLDGILKKYVE
jgi:hypothetical protein